ncbi:MAG: extracellular solute-binding protein [Firmicutes bacterium]|nr:extracellular solute-binding protein [Bacillota bacterium]
MKENLEQITSGADYAGQTCPFCGKTINPEDQVVCCPRCRSVHHVDCWKAKGGCGKAGCPQLAATVFGEKPKGDGPPPPVSKRSILAGLGIAAVLILLLIFWPKPPDPAQGRTKITVMGEAYFELSRDMNSLAMQFNDNSSEIYIDLQLLPPGGLDQKLLVLIAAGQAPDVIALSEERFDYLAEQEVLLSLGADPQGEKIYGIQHPAHLSQLTIWKETEDPQAALEVLHYFVQNITPVDLDQLRELETNRSPVMFGF